MPTKKTYTEIHKAKYFVFLVLKDTLAQASAIEANGKNNTVLKYYVITLILDSWHGLDDGWHGR